MKKIAILILLGGLMMPVCALAKDKKSDPPQEPKITEVEQLKMENLQLQAVPLQQQLAALQQQYEALLAQIENENPGYIWNPQAGKLVKKQEAPKK